MGELNLDFSNVERKTFEKPEEGEHVFVVSDAEVKPAKDKESNNLVIKADVVGGSSDGRSLLQFFSLKQEALWNVRLFLEALAGEELETISIDTDRLVGQTFVGTVRHSEDGQYANLSSFESNS